MRKKEIYASIEEAIEAIRKLNIRNRDAYRRRYTEDPLLPKTPHKAYAEDWERVKKWVGYLSMRYLTWEEASVAARKLHIYTAETYAVRCKRDGMLPRRPDTVYKDAWRLNGGWPGFLGTKFYATYSEARHAVFQLGIDDIEEYKIRYREDDHLPSTPSKAYPRSWKRCGGWPGFFQREDRRKMKRT